LRGCGASLATRRYRFEKTGGRWRGWFGPSDLFQGAGKALVIADTVARAAEIAALKKLDWTDVFSAI
jgi:hypothetical protein